MNKRQILGATMACLMLSACQADKPKEAGAADFAILLDHSNSFDLRTNASLREKVAVSVRAKLLGGEMRLGDRVVILRIGERSTDLALADVIPLDRKHRPIAVANEAYRRIMELGESGEAAQRQTNILFPLQNSGIKCPGGHGIVVIVSDAIETGPEFSDWRGLISGKAQLPAPTGKPLTGCRVHMIGVGLTSEGTEQLTSEEIAALSSAWRRWLSAAGALDVSITVGF